MTIAFIPVRGGSKSIPLKNVKDFCGKPLVYWSIFALEQTEEVDEIIVATDSDKIIEVVNSFAFKKTKIYKRSTENAQDTSTTESVMLEYIEHDNLDQNDIFLLVQATSPLTSQNDFKKALELYAISDYDSMLTGVRFKRFLWNEDGTPKNYDFQKRPRRQDFLGDFMENGAFYINKVKNITKNRNRISGKIGLFEMPEFTAFEIDEPDDWLIMEKLMRKHILQPEFSQQKTKLFLTDVDGVLTDAGMYYSENGDELKKFNTRDGMGLQLLQNNGIKVGIITSEKTKLVERRAKKLGVDYLYQGKREGGKLEAALEICKKENISIKEVAYIGDDINCLNLLEKVGLAGCPADAVEQIKNLPNINIMSKKGGEGCVREFIETIISP